MLCANFGWNWPGIFEKILKYFQYNFTFLLLSPLGEGHDSAFEQTWIPPTKGCVVPSLVETGPVVLDRRRRFLNNLDIILLFRYYLPLEKGVALHLKKLEPSLLKNALCKVWPSGFGEDVENVERLQTDRQTDNRRPEKLTWAFSSGELEKNHTHSQWLNEILLLEWM